jgi:hypothetical protein
MKKKGPKEAQEKNEEAKTKRIHGAYLLLYIVSMIFNFLLYLYV